MRAAARAHILNPMHPLTERPTTHELRRRLAVAHMAHATRAWVTRAADIAEPVVLIADSEDTLGGEYTRRAGLKHGVSVEVVSAAELASKLDDLDPIVAALLRTAERGSLFVVCCAFNGAICAYINATGDGLISQPIPGRAPTYQHVTGALSN